MAGIFRDLAVGAVGYGIARLTENNKKHLKKMCQNVSLYDVLTTYKEANDMTNEQLAAELDEILNGIK